MDKFESHITIKLNNTTALSNFQKLCQHLQVKCLLIELPMGVNTFQPMTSLYHRGSFESVFNEVTSMAQRIMNNGFQVIRVKIEALISNLNIPISDEEAKKFPNNYFEFHVLVELPTQNEVERLKIICEKHQAHLSQNAFKKSLNGVKQYFVTMRFYETGKSIAKSRFSMLLNELKKEQFSLSNQLQEYIVYDSNISLDAGWVEPVYL